MATSGDKPTCFIAMPISTHPDDVDRYNGDSEHWAHVMDSLFVRAIEAAGFQPLKPVAQGSHLIHGLIIRHLSTADLVLVDLSSHNPNVFFELGVRTSLNLPIALVRDEHTSLPFDTAGINTYTYDSKLKGWEIEEQQRNLAQHVKESHQSCAGQNPLWRQFGLTIKAQEPDADESPLEAKMDLLTDRIFHLQAKIENDQVARGQERLLGQDDPYLRFGQGTWADVQQRDPSRTSPIDLYISAMKRNFADRFWFVIERTSATSAIVQIDASASNKDLNRVRDLAQKYEVAIEIHEVGVTTATGPPHLGPLSEPPRQVSLDPQDGRPRRS